MPTSVLYALDAQGHLADAADAPRGAFTCLECGERVILRRGTKNTPHFAHESGSACAGETALHLAAKARLVETLQARSRPITLRRRCAAFGCTAVHDTPWAPPEYDEVRAEVTLGAYRLDVALLRGGVVVAGVEVYQTHRVGSVKAANLSVPWVEVSAEAVLADPHTWSPVMDEAVIGPHLEDLKRRAYGPGLLDDDGWVKAAQVMLGHAQRRHNARTEGIGPDGPWWCAACEAALVQAHADVDAAAARQKARQEPDLEQRRAKVQRDRAQRLAVADREARTHAALLAQRAEFGEDLVAPFVPQWVGYYREHARTLRFAARYLMAHVGHHKAIERNAFIARRCNRCARPLVCVDVDAGVDMAGELARVLPYVRRGRDRGHFENICPACGAPQTRDDLRRGPYVRLSGGVVLNWLMAFGRLPLGYRWD